jgi:hypothetical protein
MYCEFSIEQIDLSAHIKTVLIKEKDGFKLKLQMGWAGLEYLGEKSPEVLHDKEVSNITPSHSTIAMVQNPVHLLQNNPELMQVVENWAALPDHIKETIKTLVGTVTIAVNDQVSK